VRKKREGSSCFKDFVAPLRLPTCGTLNHGNFDHIRKEHLSYSIEFHKASRPEHRQHGSLVDLIRVHALRRSNGRWNIRRCPFVLAMFSLAEQCRETFNLKRITACSRRTALYSNEETISHAFVRWHSEWHARSCLPSSFPFVAASLHPSIVVTLTTATPSTRSDRSGSCLLASLQEYLPDHVIWVPQETYL
jgi:hypothetical protein